MLPPTLRTRALINVLTVRIGNRYTATGYITTSNNINIGVTSVVLVLLSTCDYFSLVICRLLLASCPFYFIFSIPIRFCLITEFNFNSIPCKESARWL